jgi:hypothetical protein
MGKSGTFTANTDGPLALCFNDDIRGDNRYNYTVIFNEFSGTHSIYPQDSSSVYIGEVVSGVTYHYVAYGTVAFSNRSFADANGTYWNAIDTRLRAPLSRTGTNYFTAPPLNFWSLIGQIGSNCSSGTPPAISAKTIYDVPIPGRVYRKSGTLTSGQACSGIFIFPSRYITGQNITISGNNYLFEQFSDWTGYMPNNVPDTGYYLGCDQCISRIVSENVFPVFTINGASGRLSGSGFGDPGYNIVYWYIQSGLYSGDSNHSIFTNDYFNQYVAAANSGAVQEDYYQDAGSTTNPTGFYEVSSGIASGGTIYAC